MGGLGVVRMRSVVAVEVGRWTRPDFFLCLNEGADPKGVVQNVVQREREERREGKAREKRERGFDSWLA